MTWNVFRSDRLARLLYPETLLFIGLLAGALLFIAILTRVPASLKLDVAVTLGFQRYSHPIATFAAKWLTFMGNSLTLIILAAGVLLITIVAGQLEAGIFVVLSLLSLPLNVLLKNTIDRKRPGEDQVQVHPGPRWGFSFPSGHSMGSAAFYGFLAVIVYLHVLETPWRIAFLTPLVLLPLGVGISRVYLGAHWMSDVTGGWAGGVMIVVLLAVLYPV